MGGKDERYRISTYQLRHTVGSKPVAVALPTHPLFKPSGGFHENTPEYSTPQSARRTRSGSNSLTHGGTATVDANPVAISAGDAHSMALRPDGTASVWGSNYGGQLDIPPDATNLAAIVAAYQHCLAWRDDGSIIGWGSNFAGQTSPPAHASNVVAIAAGSAGCGGCGGVWRCG